MLHPKGEEVMLYTHPQVGWSDGRSSDEFEQQAARGA